MKRFIRSGNVLDNVYSKIKKTIPKKRVRQLGLAILLFIFMVAIFKSWESNNLQKEHFSFPFLAKPHIKDGDKIYIKTVDGKYLTSCSNCSPRDANIYNKCKKTLCIRDEPYLNSQFTYHKHRDGTFSLETQEGKYWKRCAQCIPLCPHTICCDGVNPNLQTHKFVLLKNQHDREHENSVSIKTDNGRLLEVTNCDQTCGKIVTALGLNTTSRFIIEIIPPPVIPLSQRIKPVTFDHKLPQPFPKQWPYSQW
jgi:hypothetical protein